MCVLVTQPYLKNDSYPIVLGALFFPLTFQAKKMQFGGKNIRKIKSKSDPYYLPKQNHVATMYMKHTYF